MVQNTLQTETPKSVVPSNDIAIEVSAKEDSIISLSQLEQENPAPSTTPTSTDDADKSNKEVVIVVETEEKQATTYKVYGYRYFIVLFYAAVSIINALMSTYTAPLLTSLTVMYGINLTLANLGASLIFSIVYVPVSFVANYTLDAKGLRFNLTVATVCTLIGLWLNVLCQHSFAFLFIGQFFAAIGQPFLMNMPQKLSSTWFSPSQRTLATTVGSLLPISGGAIGALIPSMFVDDTILVPAHGRRQLFNMMAWIAVFGSVVIVIAAILFKNKPLTPPSETADAPKLSYKESLKNISTNKNYIIIVVSTALIYGGMSCFGSLTEPVIVTFGFTSSDAGRLASIITVVSVPVSVFILSIVSKTKKFKKIYLICAFFAFVFFVGMIGALWTEIYLVIVVVNSLFAIFVVPTISMAFEFCAEVTYPVAEGTSGGVLMAVVQLVIVAGSLSLSELLQTSTKMDSIISIVILSAMIFIGLVGFFFVKEDLRRSAIDAKCKEVKQEEQPEVQV